MGLNFSQDIKKKNCLAFCLIYCISMYVYTCFNNLLHRFSFFPRKILNEDWVITFAQLMVYVSLGDIYSIRAISLY